MRKRFWAVLLVSALTLSMPTNALAASCDGTGSEQTLPENENGLTELWTEGRDSFELISSTSDNKNFVSQFTLEDTTYQIEETFNDDYTVVESNYYEVKDSEKNFMGQQKTIFERNEDVVKVTVLEDETVIDTQTFQALDRGISDTMPGETDNSITTRAVEYRWFSQGTYNGSNNIYRYTVAGVVGVLATAAGSAVAGGLSAVAGLVISERWPAVYWSRQTWQYMQRSPSSPLYPNWTSGHKYKYYTNYYSNSRRTNYIGNSSYIDG